jgi:hypothetical protein
MAELDLFYAQLLSVGFVVMRQAAEANNRDWLEAEFELLHNVPSLIGEPNAERHRYFWSQERTHYIEWVSAPGREEAKARMTTYYEPIWNEMETAMNQGDYAEDCLHAELARKNLNV